MKWFVLSLTLLWCLVEVDSQNMRSYPNVTFMDETLANHSYVDFNLVGNDTSDSIQCHTDLGTCCSGAQGIHRGDWYFPNGTRLPFSGRDVPIGEGRGTQKVEIRSGIDTPPFPGIYRCDIPTVAVHRFTDMFVRDTVYVGLYASGGDVAISGGIVFTEISDINGPTPQFTLTCISTGGPATTVTWTRDSITVTEGNETVLDNSVTAQYTHTLTVMGKQPGVYNCTVANNKPSNDSASAVLTAPRAPEISETEAGEREVVFSWSPATQEIYRVVTGYTLTCSPSPSSLPQSLSHTGSIRVTGFSPNTLYSCSLTANNIWGPGTPSTIAFSTKKDDSFFQLRLQGVLPCTEVIASQTEQKLDDIRSAIVEQLEPLCPECSSDTIDRQSFSCYEESPSHVTYRARLEGTSERGSDSLISLIEDWVRGAPGVIVTGVLMTVDPHCSVAISSVSEPECSPATQPSECSCATNNTPSIVAGVVVVIVVIAAAISVIFIIFILRSPRRCIPNKAAKKSHGATSIHTTTNKAYEMQPATKGHLTEDYEAVDQDSKGDKTATSSKEPYIQSHALPAIPPSSEAEPEKVYETIPGEDEKLYD